ncbi:MAG: M56 family metallopeptidase [Gemmataceae bacterium]
MTEAVLRLNALSAALPALVLAVLLESALLAAAVALLSRCFTSPAVRCWLWQVVALKMLLLPLWTVRLLQPEPGVLHKELRAPATESRATQSASVNVTLVGPPMSVEPAPAEAESFAVASAPGPGWRELTWASWLLLAWLLGVAWQIAMLARQRCRLGGLLRNSHPCDDPAILGELKQQGGRLGLRWLPRVLVSRDAASPFVCGLLRPTLVLPESMAAALSGEQLRQVLLHELAHLRRGDLWWGWLPEAARLVWFFHPVTYWVSARVRLERELACDRLVLAHAGTAADYADTLVRVAGHCAQEIET